MSLWIYVNLFTDEWVYDVRWWVRCVVVVVFWKRWVWFEVGGSFFGMRLVVLFFVIGFFIWIGENVRRLLGGWEYRNEEDGWWIVDVGKISSWLLVVVMSIVVVMEEG
ncbi:DUF817 family protein, partial [Bacillus sp. WP8]|uniref:DUF817 family protein n=1 Tax=Bacillus sp. WP8 TaxID=756828 RepID=UPI0011A4BB56